METLNDNKTAINIYSLEVGMRIFPPTNTEDGWARTVTRIDQTSLDFDAKGDRVTDPEWYHVVSCGTYTTYLFRSGGPVKPVVSTSTRGYLLPNDRILNGTSVLKGTHIGIIHTEGREVTVVKDYKSWVEVTANADEDFTLVDWEDVSK